VLLLLLAFFKYSIFWIAGYRENFLAQVTFGEDVKKFCAESSPAPHIF